MEFNKVFQRVFAVWCFLARMIHVTAHFNFGIQRSHMDTSSTDAISSSHVPVPYMHVDYTHYLNPSPTSSLITHTDWPNYDWYTSPSERSSIIQSSISVTSSIPSSTNGSTLPDRNTLTTGSPEFNGTTGMFSFQMNENAFNATTPYSENFYSSPSNDTSSNSSYASSHLSGMSEVLNLSATSNKNSTNSSNVFIFSSNSNEFVPKTASNHLNIASVSDTVIVPSYAPVMVISSTPLLSSINSSVIINREDPSFIEIRGSLFITNSSLTSLLESEIEETSVLELTKTTSSVDINSDFSNINVSEITSFNDRDRPPNYLSSTVVNTLETTTSVAEIELYNKTASVLNSTTSLNIPVTVTPSIGYPTSQMIKPTSTIFETSFSLPNVSSLEAVDTSNTVQKSPSLVISKSETPSQFTDSVLLTSTTEEETVSHRMIDSIRTDITRLSRPIYISTTNFERTHAYISITPSSSSTVEVSSQIVTFSEPLQDYRIIITFEGTCGKLKDNELLKIEFIEALVDIIQSLVPNINESNLELEQFICNPFTVVLLLKNVKDQSHIVKLQAMVKNITVPIIDKTIIRYSANGVKLLPVTNTTNDDGHLGPRGLETSDIVVIVISALLFAFILLLCGIAICRECYKRKRAASFNLLNVPHVHVKMDDFSLTRIPRPKMSYFESNPNPIVTNGRHRLGADGDFLNGKVDNKVKITSENINIRMQDHSDGLVIGVTCLPIKTDGTSPSSETSSPTTPCMDQAKQSLIKDDRPEHGTTNPNCSVDDEELVYPKTFITEDGQEEFL